MAITGVRFVLARPASGTVNDWQVAVTENGAAPALTGLDDDASPYEFVYGLANSAQVTVTDAPPTLTGLDIADVSYEKNSGTKTIAAATVQAAFQVTAPATIDTYGLSSPPAGVTINSSTGAITVDTNTLTQAIHTISVTATNSGGSATETFSITVTADVTAPTIKSTSPADNATGVNISTNIAVTFSESVTFGATKTFTLYNVTGAVVAETFSTDTLAGDAGGALSVSGDTVTINPGVNLSTSTEYAIQWSAGAVQDAAGNAVAALTDTTTISFTTSATAGYTVGANATTDGTATLAATFPASNPAKMTIWFVASRSDQSVTEDILETVNAKLRLIARSGGNYRLTVYDADGTSGTVTNASSANVNEMAAGIISIDLTVGTMTIAFLDAAPGTWTVATQTGMTTLTDVGISGETITWFPDTWSGSVKRCGFATGVAVDASLTTVQNALATSDGTTLTAVSDPATWRGQLTGGTILEDVYGGAAAFNEAFNDGSLTLTKTGTFT